jgi:hypothetical protein
MKLVRVEFHCHTRYSKDSLLEPQTLLQACRRKKINRIVITDHNSIEGAQRAKEIDPQRVIIGEEVMTQSGELLAVFVQELIPPGLTVEETIRRLRDQNAFICVSHPFDQMRNGHWDLAALEEIAPLVDAIETFNARCVLPEANKKAQEFAAKHGKLQIAGSDAHTAFELGKATLRLPDFQDADGLRESLEHAQAEVSASPPWIHFTSRYAVWRKTLARLIK